MVASAFFYAIVLFGMAHLIVATEGSKLRLWLGEYKLGVIAWTSLPFACVSRISFSFTMFAVTLLNSFARILLITGCFVNLTRLQDAVYKEPERSRIIPHLGGG